MAIARIPPKCLKCGEPIEGIYKNQSHLPQMMRVIGDTFIRWDYEGHKCSKKGLIAKKIFKFKEVDEKDQIIQVLQQTISGFDKIERDLGNRLGAAQNRIKELEQIVKNYMDEDQHKYAVELGLTEDQEKAVIKMADKAIKCVEADKKYLAGLEARVKEADQIIRDKQGVIEIYRKLALDQEDEIRVKNKVIRDLQEVLSRQKAKEGTA